MHALAIPALLKIFYHLATDKINGVTATANGGASRGCKSKYAAFYDAHLGPLFVSSLFFLLGTIIDNSAMRSLLVLWCLNWWETIICLILKSRIFNTGRMFSLLCNSLLIEIFYFLTFLPFRTIITNWPM